MIGVLGGGISGLGVAYFLKQRGMESEVLEREKECGGMCRSYKVDGYTFDQGPHIIFSRDQEILDLQVRMLGDNLRRHFRNNRILFKGRFVKYPFENGLGILDKEDIFECVYHYFNNPYPAPRNFKEWMYHTFGKGLTELYLLPYNEKIWSTPANQMSCDWVEGRVPKPPAEDILKSALGIETEGYTHQLHFYYPKTGGIQAMVEAFEREAPRVTKGFEVSCVERRGSQWVVEGSGGERRFSRLINTMPLMELAPRMPALPPAVREAIGRLRYNRMYIILVALNRSRHSDKFAVYVPDPSVRFNRLSFMEYLGESYAPPGRSSVEVEITCQVGDPYWDRTDEAVGQETVEGMVRLGLVDPAEVESVFVKRVPYAYVVYDLDYAKNIQTVYDYFKAEDLPLCGRFAEFKYFNTDMCLRSAKTVADRLQVEPS